MLTFLEESTPTPTILIHCEYTIFLKQGKKNELMCLKNKKDELKHIEQLI